MTDKERLEEIKHIRNNMEEYMNPDGSVEDYPRYDELALFIIDDYLDYLIEQAERVQELEDEYRVRQTEYLEEHIDRLEKVNKRYREVVTQAISDLENECLWDALVKLKALEEDLK